MSGSDVMADKATRAVCLVAAILSLIIVSVRHSSLQSSDLPFLALVVAPYLLLVMLAGCAGKRTLAARLLFCATLVLSLGGTALLGLNNPPPYTGPEPGLALSVTMLAVPLLQLVAVMVVGLVLFVKRTM